MRSISSTATSEPARRDSPIGTVPASRISSFIGAGERQLARLFGWKQFTVALLGLAAAGLFLHLGSGPVAMHSERRCFDAAQHMVETGNWLTPYYEGAPRFQKPPLCYWAAALGAGPDEEISRFALRAPAALAALALVGVVFAWGRMLGGTGAGALSVLVLLGTSLFWTLGRRGVAEMPLTLFTTGALFAFSLIYWDKRARLLWLFFFAVSLGFFAKATTVLLVIGLPIVLQLVHDRTLGKVMQRRIVIGALVCALGCLSWYAALVVVEPLARAAFEEALLLPLGMAQSSGDTTHYRPFWYYVPLILLVALPAVLLAPAPFVRIDGRRVGFAHPPARFVGVAIASLFVVFSLIPMKQKHYLISLVPLFAVLVGYSLHELVRVARPTIEAWVRRLGVALLASAHVIALAIGLHLWLVNELAAGIAWAVVVLLAGATGFAASRERSLRSFVACTLVVMTVFLYVKETSFTVWCGRFKTGTVETAKGFQAERWRQAFSTIPAMVPLYEARKWKPPDA